jgi:hypothetical protein
MFSKKEALGVGCGGAWMTFLISLFVVGFQKASVINCLMLVAPATYGVARLIEFISEAAPVSPLGLLLKFLLMIITVALWIGVATHSSTPFWEWF